MEERELWGFTPTVTHGDLHEDSLLIDEQRVVAVTGWTDLHIGDPADDFAWLTASPDVEFSDAVLAAYRSHRRGPSDPHLMRRAALSAEFALAQWLVRGHTTENQEMVDEARELLRQLEEDVLAHGGQPISLSSPDAEPAGEDEPTGQTGPAGAQDSKPVARPGAAATVADTGEWADSGVGDDEPAVITDAGADESGQEDTEEAADQPAGEAAESGPQPELDAEPSPSVADDDAQHTAPVPRPPQHAAEEQPTGEIPPPGSDAPADAEASIEADEQPTGALPAVDAEDPEHAAESAETTETAETTGPTTGELPIAPDEGADRRAREKRFFPPQSSDSAASADSARSAESATSAGEPGDTSEQSEQSRSEEQEDVAAEADAPSSSSRPSRLTDTSDSVYSAFPGLRPPKS